ncbi:G-protein-coupled receptor family protein [Cavenderia fasciculata]|uniref:G-protein-coupled receptor family protein n=1 Tax=Cavenderia fasciculata TaxID=261658 RepID=F4Q3K1_CACFS|nr:G-protein-coupled receptor family protein [Cavenderia fasciculata]EGG17659.1 G-protein-coupled receptor family protein [Cavenderia fasciculata]|eukprot:XP_004356143.1 G-protein-coupled receptor family protein [Cavenderia fasciculata]
MILLHYSRYDGVSRDSLFVESLGIKKNKKVKIYDEGEGRGSSPLAPPPSNARTNKDMFMCIPSLRGGYLFAVLFSSTTLAQDVVTDPIIDFGARCEVINPASQCVPYLNYTNVFIGNGTNQTYIEQITSDVLYQLLLAPTECQVPAISLTCLGAYRQCNSIEHSTPQINIASPICYSQCDKTYQGCHAFFETFGIPFSCDGTTNGTVDFPVIGLQYNFSQYNASSDVVIPCNIESTTNANITDCPLGLQYVPEDKRDDKLINFISEGCAIPCPFRALSDKEYDITPPTKAVIRYLSLIASSILLIVYVVVPNVITPRMECIIYYSLASILFTASSFIESSEDHFECGDGLYRYKYQSDVSCGISYFLFQFGALNIIFWWGMIAYDFYVTTQIKSIANFWRFRIGLWSTSALLAAIPLMGGQVGAQISTGNCWILTNDTQLWQYLTFLVPVWIVLLVITFFMMASLLKVYKFYKVVKDKNLLFFNIKMILVLLYVVLISIFLLFYMVYLNGRKHIYLDIISDYIKCIVANKNDLTKCSVVFPDFEVRYVCTITFGSLGVLGFISLLVDTGNKQLFVTSSKIIYVINKFLAFKQSLTNSSTTSSISTGSSKSPASASSAKNTAPSSPSWLQASKQNKLQQNRQSMNINISKILNQQRVNYISTSESNQNIHQIEMDQLDINNNNNNNASDDPNNNNNNNNNNNELGNIILNNNDDNNNNNNNTDNNNNNSNNNNSGNHEIINNNNNDNTNNNNNNNNNNNINGDINNNNNSNIDN